MFKFTLPCYICKSYSRFYTKKYISCNETTYYEYNKRGTTHIDWNGSSHFFLGAVSTQRSAIFKIIRIFHAFALKSFTGVHLNRSWRFFSQLIRPARTYWSIFLFFPWTISRDISYFRHNIMSSQIDPDIWVSSFDGECYFGYFLNFSQYLIVINFIRSRYVNILRYIWNSKDSIFLSLQCSDFRSV